MVLKDTQSFPYPIEKDSSMKVKERVSVCVPTLNIHYIVIAMKLFTGRNPWHVHGMILDHH